MDTLKISKNLTGKDLFLVLLNIYNLGYWELCISGSLENLLDNEVKPMLYQIAKELEVYLDIENPDNIPFDILKFGIKGIKIKSKDTYLTNYIQNSFPNLRVINE